MKEMGRFKGAEILVIFVFVKVEHSDGVQFGDILVLATREKTRMLIISTGFTLLLYNM